MLEELFPTNANSLLQIDPQRVAWDTSKEGQFLLSLGRPGEVDWVSSTPARSIADWSGKQLVKKWEWLYEGKEPLAQISYMHQGEYDTIVAPVGEPIWDRRSKKLVFGFDASDLSSEEKDLITGLPKKRLTDVSVIIEGPSRFNETATGNNSDFITTESGLKIRDITIGTGQTAVPIALVGVTYVGYLQNGKVFDSSDDSLEFRLGQGQVIKGFDEGILGMRVGGRRQLVIPPELGYGARGIPGKIPPNSTVIYEIRLDLA